MMRRVFLGFGSNIEPRENHLRHALAQFSVMQVSSIYETEPIGYIDQSWFLNLVAEVDFEASAQKLLEKCQSIESEMGRRRDIPKGPRNIDIDILFVGEEIISEPDLVIPHPSLPQRNFVLIPLAEIAADFVHPVLDKTINELLKDCVDRGEVRRVLDRGEP